MRGEVGRRGEREGGEREEARGEEDKDDTRSSRDREGRVGQGRAEEKEEGEGQGRVVERVMGGQRWAGRHYLPLCAQKTLPFMDLPEAPPIKRSVMQPLFHLNKPMKKGLHEGKRMTEREKECHSFLHSFLL